MMDLFITDLLQVLIPELESSGRERTASAYRSAVQSLLTLLNSDAPPSGLLSPEGLNLYEKRLRGNGLCNNTISFYMRMLRAIYNKGVTLGFCVEQPHLFDGVYTGIDHTPKRAVSPTIFGVLQSLELSDKKNLEFARDLFLLSFCLQGISFVDLAHLLKTDLKDSLLTYHRAKTGSPITVALSDLAQFIIRKYAGQTIGSPYLLPIIKNPDGDTRLQYKSALRTYNRRLKKVAELGGIEENLTSYVARHTWATAARHEDVPIGVISQAMGHKTEEVTHIYLANYDHSALFQANEKVLQAANLITRFTAPDKEANQVKQKNVSHSVSERQFQRQT